MVTIIKNYPCMLHVRLYCAFSNFQERTSPQKSKWYLQLNPPFFNLFCTQQNSKISLRKYFLDIFLFQELFFLKQENQEKKNLSKKMVFLKTRKSRKKFLVRKCYFLKQENQEKIVFLKIRKSRKKSGKAKFSCFAHTKLQEDDARST